MRLTLISKQRPCWDDRMLLRANNCCKLHSGGWRCPCIANHSRKSENSQARGIMCRSLPGTRTQEIATIREYLGDHDAMQVFSECAKISQTRTGRGLIATRDIEAREMILSIPFTHILMTLDDVERNNAVDAAVFFLTFLTRWEREHGTIPDLLKYFVSSDLPWVVKLCAWLLWVLKSESPYWSGYKALLPKSREMWEVSRFSKDEILELQVPEWVKAGCDELDWITAVHEKLFCGELRELELADDVNDTLRAASLVTSRSFAMQLGDFHTSMIAPFADIANHGDHHQAAFVRSEVSQVGLIATQDIPMGQEIIINYGQKSNFEFVRDYGFAIEGNPGDRVRLVGGDVPKLLRNTFHCALGVEGKLVREGLGCLEGTHMLKSLGFDETELGRLVAAIKSIPVRDRTEDKELWPFSTSTVGMQHAPLDSLTAERNNVEKLKEAVNTSLQQFPTSMEQDAGILSKLSQDREPCRFLAVSARLEYKKVMQMMLVVLELYDEALMKSIAGK